VPLDPSAPVVRSPFVSHRGEAPRTLLLDAEDAIRVSVLRRPDDDPSIRDVLAAFVSSTHAYRPPLVADPDRDPWDDVAGGRTLWQNAEILSWTLLVEGVDRNLSHQIVRTRVGVTFSQQCTGERDCRHDDVLIPRAYARPGFEARAVEFVRGTLDAKRRYADDVDAGISVQEARRGLPHSCATYLVANWALSSLALWYVRRADEMTQDWLMYRLAEAVRAAVVGASPWAASAVKAPPAASSWYSRNRESGSITHLFSPSGTPYDDHAWNPSTYEHGALSHRDVSSGPAVPPRLYVGEDLVAVGAESVREALAGVDPEGAARLAP